MNSTAVSTEQEGSIWDGGNNRLNQAMANL